MSNSLLFASHMKKLQTLLTSVEKLESDLTDEKAKLDANTKSQNTLFASKMFALEKRIENAEQAISEDLKEKQRDLFLFDEELHAKEVNLSNIAKQLSYDKMMFETRERSFKNNNIEQEKNIAAEKHEINMLMHGLNKKCVEAEALIERLKSIPKTNIMNTAYVDGAKDEIISSVDRIKQLMARSKK